MITQSNTAQLNHSGVASLDDPESDMGTLVRMADFPESCADPELGQQIFHFIASVYPICRSITGDGVRLTLSAIESLIDIDRHEVPTGTPVLDWTVPKEWSVRDVYVANSRGERVIDFRRSCLHVMGYSV